MAFSLMAFSGSPSAGKRPLDLTGEGAGSDQVKVMLQVLQGVPFGRGKVRAGQCAVSGSRSLSNPSSSQASSKSVHSGPPIGLVRMMASWLSQERAS